MLEGLAILLAAIASLTFASRRSLRLLRFLQQEEYAPRRFLAWVLGAKAWDRRGSLVCATVALLIMLPLHFELPADTYSNLTFLLSLVAACLLFYLAYLEPDPRTSGKIKLKMTERAKRIYRISIELYLLSLLCSVVFTIYFFASGAYFSPAWYWLLQLLFIQALPLFLALGVLILTPEERLHQGKFVREAKERLSKIDPFVIGITGSYGKTSTKAVLNKFVSAGLGATFSPRDGINTVMGNTRAIREGLASHHKYAIFEMGAYQKGSIKKLCDLTPPKAAIITAIGIMHLGRFGSRDDVLEAKSELAQAVCEEGILVCNGDDPGARTIAERYRKKTTLLYGFDNSKGDLDCYASEVNFSVEGSHFLINWDKKAYEVFTPLHGRPALSNCLAAFSLACALGADPDYLVAVFRNLEAVKNRLQVELYPNGCVQINDAYNSNPLGFAAALEVLKVLPGNRKVLMTPGMVDLGDEQFYENFNLAKEAAEICHQVMVVGRENRESLRKGLEEGGMGVGQMRFFEDRESAFARLAVEQKSGHVVLIENDLPDLFETEEKF